ncbi:MAG: flagellar hook-length control protein FliK [Deltaproteobacteria bacterium]|nr:flagellar hook-length control protein FliK [Deltaproteobacteria bacterium]
MVEGRFVKSISTSRAIVVIRGKPLVARLSSRINVSGPAYFRVEQVAPEYVLRLVHAGVRGAGYPAALIEATNLAVDAYQALTDWIWTLIETSKKDPLPDEISRFWDLAKRVAVKADESINSHDLKRLIRHGGMTWEHQLKAACCDSRFESHLLDVVTGDDLKALALKALGQGLAVGFRSLSRLVQFVNTLEQLQLANLAGLQENGVLSWIIPALQQGKLHFVRLLVGLPGKRGHNTAKRKGLSVCLLLEMSRLGPIRIEVVVHGSRLVGLHFVVRRKAAEKILKKNMQQLRKRLSEQGFFVASILCQAEPKATCKATCFPPRLMEFQDHDICVIA